MTDSLTSLPTTPFRQSKQRKPHHPSPAFSNYFSDDDQSGFSPVSPTHPCYTAEMSSSPPHSDSTHTYFDSPVPTKPDLPPFHMALIERLQHLSAHVFERDLDDRIRMELEVKLNELERTLIAPDVQSRESAEGSDSALFLDDEDDERIRHAETVADYEAQLRQSSKTEYALQSRVDALRDEVEHLQDIRDYRELQIQDRDVTIQILEVQNGDLIKSLRAARDDLFKLVVRVETIDLLTSQRAKQSHTRQSHNTDDGPEQLFIEGTKGEDVKHIEHSMTTAEDDESDLLEGDSEDDNEEEDNDCHHVANDETQTTFGDRPITAKSTTERLEELTHQLQAKVKEAVRLDPWDELWQGLSHLFGGVREEDDE